MNLVMAGIDYKTAPVEVRERFSLTASASAEALAALRGEDGVRGVVLLGTCNRAELYLSAGKEVLQPAALLCRALGLPPAQFGGYFISRSGRRAAKHLMMVASGLRSQIRGEDQILTQVKEAAFRAREAGAADAVLETLFRCAVTAGKRVKTEVPLALPGRSAAHRAVELLRGEPGGLAEKRALVIGSGEMGRLAAGLLMREGCAAAMTLRSYRQGEALLPAGCAAVPYEERYGAMEGIDILLSATVSPHHTVKYDPFLAVRNPPRVLVDLAVPRDIDPLLAELPEVCVLNMDGLGISAGTGDRGRLLRISAIQEEEIARFYRWLSFREELGGRDRMRMERRA